MKNKWILLLIPLLLGQFTAQAQEAFTTSQAFYIISGFVLIVAIMVLVVSIVVLQVLRVFVKREMEAKGLISEVEKKKGWWQKFLTKANDAVPLEEEADIVLDHNYDGIRELDNHLPPWWKWLFYVTVIFGVVYLLAYHVFSSMPLQTEEYEMEMAIAEEARLARLANQPQKSIDVSNVEFVDDREALAKGAQIFNFNCAACHKEDGGGGIGPNLTDQYWLHGGSIQDVFTTVKEGVPEKGMISWKDMLSPEQMQNVSSYVLTFQGKTPANPKEPQGELYVPEESEGESESDSTQVESDTTQVASDTTQVAAL